MDSEVSLQYSQELAVGTILRQLNPIYCPTPSFIDIHLTVILAFYNVKLKENVHWLDEERNGRTGMIER
jgi:hypothetical protein